MSRITRTTALLGIASAATLALLPATAFAARHGGGPSTGSGTCTANPNPVAVDTTYAVVGASLPANTTIDVYIADPVGTSADQSMTSATGTFSVSEYAWHTGTHSVSITDLSKRTLATCTFQVN